MWNWCGRMNIANAPSSTSGMKPPLLAGGGTGVAATAGRSPSPHQTNTPSASIAPSLSSDSNAIASTRPRLCSAALTRRVPNSIANSAMASATYRAMSCHTGRAPPLPPRPVSTAKLIAIAFSCSAMYGTSPSTATSVTVAASQVSLPRRVAMRSAMDVALVSRASCTSRTISAAARAYSRIAPRKVGGSGQP